MHFTSFQQMLDSLKPTQSALDFWREVDRWQAAASGPRRTGEQQ